jgi:poly-gamma-glutamate synthesis protein (capsule biosynthesis protein)
MKNQNPMQMSLVTARTITDLVPEDLSALMISDFPTVGPTVRVCAVGDIGLSGRVEITMNAIGSEAIIDQVAPVLRHADITFGNLEFPLTGEIAHGQLFSAPVTGAALLKKSGFKVLHLANTHVYDYGQAGLMATLEALRKAGLVPLGADDDFSTARNLVRTDTNGLRIGWLGCGRTLVPQRESGPSYWEFNEEELVKAVTYNRASVDLLIVSIHTGLMYMDYPRPEHKAMGERLLTAGANVILMHHAHVLQGVQVTLGKGVCCYNLGNFVLDWQEGKVKNTVMLREQNEGAIFHFIFDRRGVAQAAALPIWVDDRCIVHWATGMRGMEILNRLVRISRDLECDFVTAFKRQRAERNTEAIFKVIWFHLQRGNWAYVLESLRKARLEHLGMLVRWVFGMFKRFAKGTTG